MDRLPSGMLKTAVAALAAAAIAALIVMTGGAAAFRSRASYAASSGLLSEPTHEPPFSAQTPSPAIMPPPSPSVAPPPAVAPSPALPPTPTPIAPASLVTSPSLSPVHSPSPSLSPSLSPAPSSSPSLSPSPSRAPEYRERRGVVSLDLPAIFSRITIDSDEYAVAAKRVEIEKRNLSYAMRDKFTADNTVSPAAPAVAKRVQWEKDRRIKWRRAEMSVKEAEEAAKNIVRQRETGLKSQYVAILNLGDSLESVSREIESQKTNQAALEAKIAAGTARASELDAYAVRAAGLAADKRAIEREIALAERKLKRELKIDESKRIALAPFEDEFTRYNDRRVERDIDAAVAADFDVTRAEWEIGVLKEERDIMLMCDRDGELIYDLQINETAILEAEYALVDARAGEEASLWTSYYALLNQEDAVESAEISLAMANNSLALAEARLEAGLAAFAEVSDARLSADEALSQFHAAISEYARMSENFTDILF